MAAQIIMAAVLHQAKETLDESKALATRSPSAWVLGETRLVTAMLFNHLTFICQILRTRRASKEELTAFIQAYQPEHTSGIGNAFFETLEEIVKLTSELETNR